MADADLQQLFKRAAEIAKQVPESMQEAAFHRALDALTQQSPRASRQPAQEHKPRRTQRGKGVAPRTESEVADPIAQLMAMERPRAKEVDENDGSLGKGLALLRAARRELDIDGLTSQQIATVLTDKFRWRVTRQAINQAMDSAGSMVDRVPAGRGTKIRIMEAGERWLDRPAEERTSGPAQATRRGSSRSRRRSATKTAQRERADDAEGQRQSTGGTRRPSRGPKVAVEELIAAGWFAEARDLAAIRSELESRLALRFKATDLSPTMTRLLREGKLRRSKSPGGQYEYES